jgi:hypothetical protein
VVAGENRYLYVGTYCGTPYVYARGLDSSLSNTDNFDKPTD